MTSAGIRSEYGWIRSMFGHVLIVADFALGCNTLVLQDMATSKNRSHYVTYKNFKDSEKNDLYI